MQPQTFLNFLRIIFMHFFFPFWKLYCGSFESIWKSISEKLKVVNYCGTFVKKYIYQYTHTWKPGTCINFWIVQDLDELLHSLVGQFFFDNLLSNFFFSRHQDLLKDESVWEAICIPESIFLNWDNKNKIKIQFIIDR